LQEVIKEINKEY